MKNLLIKISFSTFLLLSIVLGAQAQVIYFKTLIHKIDSLQQQLAPDMRVAILAISIDDTLQHKITIRGETDLPNAKKEIFEIFAANKIEFIDAIKLLPDSSFGDKTWGLASLSVSNLRTAPTHPAEMVSQALLGTPLRVLQKTNGWLRVQTPDNYIGWMDDSGLALVTKAELSAWKKSERYFYKNNFGVAYSSPSLGSEVVSDLVMGDLFESMAQSGDFLSIRFPDGRKAFVLKNECIPYQEWVSGKPKIASVLNLAKSLLGVPYLWGGTSTKAVDCSGMTKTAWFSEGVILSRDASQQVRYGKHIDFTDRQNLKPGDLLFFGKNLNRVTHVGMYLGDDLYVHASGLVRINSLNPTAENYLPGTLERLVAANRIVQALDSEGIVRIGRHPWYN